MYLSYSYICPRSIKIANTRRTKRMVGIIPRIIQKMDNWYQSFLFCFNKLQRQYDFLWNYWIIWFNHLLLEVCIVCLFFNIVCYTLKWPDCFKLTIQVEMRSIGAQNAFLSLCFQTMPLLGRGCCSVLSNTLLLRKLSRFKYIIFRCSKTFITIPLKYCVFC